MDIKITPKTLSGSISAIPSKSDAHRALICAALSDCETELIMQGTSDDIKATADCIKALGGDVRENDGSLTVTPIKSRTVSPILDCGESGSTLRFFFPLANLVSENPTFTGRGRLPLRPLSPLREQMEEHGITINEKMLPITTYGKLSGGKYTLSGNVSSQFITGLLFALPLCGNDSEIILTTPLESKGYISMTLSTLKAFGISITEQENKYIIKGNSKYISPKTIKIDGDWSNSAFWLCAGAMAGKIKCDNLSPLSNQGDKEIIPVLKAFGCDIKEENDSFTASEGTLKAISLDCTDIPDLVPIISAVAAVSEGTTLLTGVKRLKIKESDRLSAVCSVLGNLGADIHATDDCIKINGKKTLTGGICDGFNDHRMVMMAAIAAIKCENPVTISGFEAINKSYPQFFEDYKALGGEINVI